jgi:hypothetical protein
MATTFMDRIIGDRPVSQHHTTAPDLSGSKVTDADGGTAYLEVTVSIGEFDPGQTVIGFTSKLDGYVSIGLDFTATHRLMCALQDALNIHASQPEEATLTVVETS